MLKTTVLTFFIMSLFFIQLASAANSYILNRPACYKFCGNSTLCVDGFSTDKCKWEQFNWAHVGCYTPAISCLCKDPYFLDTFCSNTQSLSTCTQTCYNYDLACIGGCKDRWNCQLPCSNNSTYCLCTTFNFRLSVNPTSGTVTQGGSITTTVTTKLTTFNSYMTNFSCSYLSEGMSCSFNPPGCEPPCSSTLTMSTSPTTTAGTYDIVVEGSGAKTKYAIYSLTVAYSGNPQMKMWIKDPNGKTIVDPATLTDCNTQESTQTCEYNYYTCSVTGMYTGLIQDVGSGTYSSWKNLWYCEACGNGRCDEEENCIDCEDCHCSIHQLCCPDGTCRESCMTPLCGNGVCEGVENCVNCVQDCGCTIDTLCCPNGECKGSCDQPSVCNDNGKCEIGENCQCADCYNEKDSCGDDLTCNTTTKTCQCPPDKPDWVVDHCGPTPLCGNGIIDSGESCLNCPDDAGCLSGKICCDGICQNGCDVVKCNNNGICDPNENCNCNDCLNWQDRCLEGLKCGENKLCGCSAIEDRVCPDDPSCYSVDSDCLKCNKNNICEQGESCSCDDCYGKKDGCSDDLICNATTKTCQCPSDEPYWNIDHCGPTPLCGNGIIDSEETCLNCPDDAGCLKGKRCCQDGVCRNDCSGPGCDNNGICDRNETYFETCDCSDCLDRQDRCLNGLVCKEDELCGCHSISDKVCPGDPSCEMTDPDCECPISKNGICEKGETQNDCPTDCKTVVSVSPVRMYPGDNVTVTVYFNDSRYSSGEDVKLSLYIDDMEWSSCVVHESKWTEMGWNRINSWIGKYKGNRDYESNIYITSSNMYSKIVFDCIVPTDLLLGPHKLRATPSIFSEEKILDKGETEFFVEDNSVKIIQVLKFGLDIIRLIF